MYFRPLQLLHEHTILFWWVIYVDRRQSPATLKNENGEGKATFDNLSIRDNKRLNA